MACDLAEVFFFFSSVTCRKDSLVTGLVLETTGAKTSFESDGGCLLGTKKLVSLVDACVCVGQSMPDESSR
jgi:hypothetical protein